MLTLAPVIMRCLSLLSVFRLRFFRFVYIIPYVLGVCGFAIVSLR